MTNSLFNQSQPASAFHGGKSFEAIGEDFQSLERSKDIINADVLDAWFDPSPRVIEKLRNFLPFLSRTSPPIYASGLREAIARTRNLPEECILTAGGSSDLIFACFPHLIARAQKALILDPMYSEYRYILENVIGARVERFYLAAEDDFCLNTDALIASIGTLRPDLVVVVNPNSPTGRHCSRTEILRLLNGIPESVSILIDETYIEYARTAESVEAEACERGNLFVLKSMSKVYALSGLRVGYLISSRSNTRYLARWIPPWAVSLPAQVAAVEALSDGDYYKEQYRQTAILREQFASDFSRIAPQLKVYPSMTNLILVETACSAERIVGRMRAKNIYVRNCDSMGSKFADRFIRIAVKQQADNQRIVRALSSAL
jgi:histidinol-phosphate/aromatic aminotransferase/cobyric acid decarboxylase-like protein